MSLSWFVALLFMMSSVMLNARDGARILDAIPGDYLLHSKASTDCNDPTNSNSCTCVPRIEFIEDQVIYDGESFIIDLLGKKEASNYFWEIEMNNVIGAEPGGGKIIEQSLCIIDHRFEAFVDFEIFPRNKLCVGKPISVRIYVRKKEEAAQIITSKNSLAESKS